MDLQDIGLEKVLKFIYGHCVIVFAGYWNRATDDKFQKDGRSSYFVSGSTWDRKGVVSVLFLMHSLWPPCVADVDIIFLSRFFLLFSSCNLSSRRLYVYRTSAHGVALMQI